MAQYQLVPYTFRFHVSGKPQEVRPLADITAKGLNALDFIARAAQAHAGPPRREESTSDSSLQIDRVSRTGQVAMIEAASGVTGVRARLRRAGEAGLTDIREDDWTETPLRNVFYAASGKRVGLLLVERVGSAGVMTKLSRMLNASLAVVAPELRLHIAPAMSEEAMKRWAKDAEVKTLTLQHVNTGTGEQARSLKGLPIGRVVEFRAPRKRSWRLDMFGGLDAATQKSILTEIVPELPGVNAERAEAVAQQMLDEGWIVALGLKKDGHQRRMQVESKVGITVTFPASAAGNTTSRPKAGDFQEACRTAIDELSTDGLDVGPRAGCTWDDEPWKDDAEPWKAVWGVPEPEPGTSTD